MSPSRAAQRGRNHEALVFHGPGQTSWQDVPDPSIKDAADAIVRVDAVTICGTDLHIIKGDVPEVTPGRILGHEAVGTVVETGGDVRSVRPGDRVLISCISACGRCRFCREAHYGQCRGGGGWVLGHTIDGTQAEYVRVPFADLSVHPLPSALASHDAVLLADIFPTSYEVGVLNGDVRPGDTVVVVGAGPIGLAAVATAQLYSPGRIIAVDLAASRLDAARDLGADATASADEEPERLVEDLTDGLGADVVIEPSACPRRSRCAPAWSARAAGSPTSGSTASPPSSTSKTCGSRTSPSPPASSTPGPPPCCSA